MASDWHGVSVAPGDTLLTVSPTWERLDNRDDLRLARIEIHRGRQDEFERTDTGTATLTFKDRNGVLDPTNLSGPFGDLTSRPIGIALRDPVTDVWWPRFRGVIEDYSYSLSPSQRVAEVTLSCVDALEYFAGYEMVPGNAGHPLPDVDDAEGQIFYDNTLGTADDRVHLALDDCNWPALGLRAIFSTNVRLRETTYSAGQSILEVLQDCADAEWPNVGVFYIDAAGFACLHGRFARFDPDTVISSSPGIHWPFHRWKAGDGAAIALDDEYAQIRPPYGFQRGRAQIRNSALCYPAGTLPKNIPAATVDAASIAVHGTRSWSATDLVVLEGVTTGNTGLAECAAYSAYIVANYGQPANRVDRVSLKSLRPTDRRAEATWALLTRVDLNDFLQLSVTHPGGGFVNDEHVVEGINYTITPLVGDLETGYPMINLDLDLSPQIYWQDSGGLS